MTRLYWKIEQRIAPGLRFSQDHYQEILSAQIRPDIHWLDLGCGWKILPEWKPAEERALVSRCQTVVGIDADAQALLRHRSVALRALADITRPLPFAGHSFDLVTANMVLEHLREPKRLFDEVHRVLRPGGTFLFHTPNAKGYYVQFARLIPEKLKKRMVRALENRQTEDVYPTHYLANSRDVLRELASGFASLKLIFVRTNALLKPILPLVFVELLWLRMLASDSLQFRRTNIIGVCVKQGEPRPSASLAS